MPRKAIALAIILLAGGALHAQEATAFKPGAKVFVDSMPNNFDAVLKTAIAKKQVPVTVVDAKEQADLEIRGTSESQKAGAAKKIILGSWHSDEQASIQVIDLKSSQVVFAYNTNKENSVHGQRSSAEACAKHLKEALESGTRPATDQK
jgi:hypothetical protein